MRSYKKLSVGIKELKDRASEIIALVQRTGQTVSITKNQQEVARIMPVPADANERLIAAGLVQPGPKPRPLSELNLKPLTSDASPARPRGAQASQFSARAIRARVHFRR